MKRELLTAALGLVALTGCQNGDDSRPPQVAISAPAFGASVGGVVPIQISATDDRGIARVQVYVRGQGTTGRGLLIGSAVQEPYVVGWSTTAQPNLADLELVAVATDSGGNDSQSDPVRVRISNAGAPSLVYLAGFTLPPKPATSAARLNPLSSAGIALDPGAIRSPDARTVMKATTKLRPLDLGRRQYALEWAWQPYPGADGYGIFNATSDLAGPYTRLTNVSATGAGTQKNSSVVPDATPGSRFWGAITAITNNASSESGSSNADTATFLPPQDSAAPEDGSTVSNGFPTFTWTPTPGTTGYLLYIADRELWDPNVKINWFSGNKSLGGLSVTYPNGDASRPALAPGTYYWWVVGVSFDALGKAESFSYADPKRFTVP